MIRSTFLDSIAYHLRSGLARGALACAAAGFLTALWPSIGHAQNELQNWADKDKSSWKKPAPDRRAPAPPFVVQRNGEFNDDYTKEKCDEFFKKRFFPEMLDPAKSRLPELGQDPRFDPVTQMRGYLTITAGAPNQQVYQEICQNALLFSKAIAKNAGMYPPARVEAVLIIAEVNSPEATTQLLEIAGIPGQASQMPDALRVTALAGLLQQAKQGWVTDAGVSGRLITTMILFAKAPLAEGPSADAWRWMRGQAAEILGLMKWTGKANEVPDALLTMVIDVRNDPKMPALTLNQRCQAARALSQLNFGGGVNAQNYVAGLTLLAHDIRTSPHANDRRFLRARLGDVLAALDKLLTVANGNAKTQASAVKAALQADYDTLETTKPDADTLKSMNDRSLKAIDRYLPK